MRNRIKYSQNFLRNSELVRSLVNKSSISPNDTVYEIGAGEGIITKQLLEKAGKVVAFELDRNFFNKLVQKFQNEKSLELRLEDFLASNLPDYSYKIFSNIPFNITSAIIKKLTLASNPPEDTYLIVQKEAAMKFAGRPLDSKNSQLSVILNPWFEFRVMYNFRSDDFYPRPNIEIILLGIKRRDNPLVGSQNKEKYEDFITYTFSQFKPNIKEGLSKILNEQNIIKLGKEAGFSPNFKPSELNFRDWIDLFNLFLKMPEKQQNIVRSSFLKQLKQQENIEKINRTRVDKSWKKYRR